MDRATLLMVEDEVGLHDLYRTVVESEGYTILEARDGVEAVELYKQFRNIISLVVVDLGLPRLDGREVFERIRRLNTDAKVIFVSGYGNKKLAADLRDAGGREFIEKPYVLRDFLRIIRETVRGD